MLDKTEIALLEVAKKEIDKKMSMKGNDKKTTGLSLFTSFIHADSSIPSRHKIRRIVRKKTGDVLMWCVLVTGSKIELPISLDENNEISVVLDVWEGDVHNHILDIRLNELKYLHLEYDSKDKNLHQYNYNDPHDDDFTNEQIIDVKLFKETSSLSVIAELEEKYGVGIVISLVPEQEGLVYGIVTGSDSSKCSAITTKDYSSIDDLLEALENEILPEYQKMADSFVKLNSIVKGAKIQ